MDANDRDRMIVVETKLDGVINSLNKIDERLSKMEGNENRIARLEERQQFNTKIIHATFGGVIILGIETAVVLIARFL